MTDKEDIPKKKSFILMHATKANAFMAFIITALTLALAFNSSKGDSLVYENEYINKLREDITNFKPDSSSTHEDLEALRIRADRRGCEQHKILEFLYPDFRKEMQRVCKLNSNSSEVLDNLTSALQSHLSVQKTAEPKTGKKLNSPTPASIEVDSKSPYVLDVFWCESVDRVTTEDQNNRKIAELIAAEARSGKLVSRIRVRKLDATTALTGLYWPYYGNGVQALMDFGDEAILNVIKDKIALRGIDLQLDKVDPADRPPNTYLSIFVCYNSRKLDGTRYAPPVGYSPGV